MAIFVIKRKRKLWAQIVVHIDIFIFIVIFIIITSTIRLRFAKNPNAITHNTTSKQKKIWLAPFETKFLFVNFSSPFEFYFVLVLCWHLYLRVCVLCVCVFYFIAFCYSKVITSVTCHSAIYTNTFQSSLRYWLQCLSCVYIIWIHRTMGHTDSYGACMWFGNLKDTIHRPLTRWRFLDYYFFFPCFVSFGGWSAGCGRGNVGRFQPYNR